ncbi:MAG: transcription elongation factor GreA [Anaerolineae bacterium]|nr:transcription elongation factor GreA [Anaerolineae bacterium]
MSSRTVVYLTPEGFLALEEELAFLTTVRRQEVAARLHSALSEGEFIENAELEEARREQAFLEGRIIEIEEQLRKAEIISKREDSDGIVRLGDTVSVREEGTDTDEEYLMVGSAEADPRKGRISNESPLGRALIGKHVGENAVVRAPDGDIVFKIISSS